MNYNLIQGDCVERMSEMEPESVHLALFSPPYDSIRDYTDAGYSFNYNSIGEQLARILVDGGVAVVLIQDGTKDHAKSLTHHRMVLNWADNHGLKLFETCLYTRQRAPRMWWNIRFREDHDYIHIFFKGVAPRKFDKEHMKVPSKQAGQVSVNVGTRHSDGTVYHRNSPWVINDKTCVGTVQRYTDRGNAKLKGQHPAVMSDKFASDYIQCFTDPGDTVLDPYVGSGTTVVQAIRHDRIGIGIDLSSEYLELAQKRIDIECSQQSLWPGSLDKG